MAKIGLFGGTFDPIHEGHLQTALFIRNEFGLDKILFIPANIPPNKSDKRITDGQARLEMINLALHDYNGILESNNVELERAGSSYTIETIRYFQSNYPEHEYYLMMGSDNLDQFATWKKWLDILKAVPIIVFKKHRDILTIPDHLLSYSNRILLSKSPLINLSSTEIRNRIYSNKTVNSLIDKKVENYIISNGLYR